VPQLEGYAEVDPWHRWLWRAWTALSASRRGGFGALPIPVTEISAYVGYLYPDFDADDRELFLDAIQALDAVFLKAMEKKHKEPKPKE
jgi:hypothetical protein